MNINTAEQKTVFLSSAYLAPVQYYSKLAEFPQAYIEQYDHYIKQTYRNRCIISGPNGPVTLTVPVVHPNSPKCYMKDIEVSDHGNWRSLHWNAIGSAYNKTPFFEYYKDDFRPFYEKKYKFLFDFNEELCRMICSLIDLSVSIERTDGYKTDFKENEFDFRESINPKKDFRQDDPYFIPSPYYQVFEYRQDFQPNLSIIDLLFNMGPESLLILQPHYH